MNSVGSLGKLPKEMDVTGLTVKNCTLVGTANGIRIKTYPASDPSSASEILFQDINMNNVHNPIIIDQNYGAKSSQVLLLFSNTYIYKLLWIYVARTFQLVDVFTSTEKSTKHVRFSSYFS